MAYIGTIPAEAYTSFAVQHFTTSATDTFTLDFPVANENEIALFINNVRQEPGSSYAYTASGTTLTLSSAITGSDSMYCVFIGKAVQTVTPASGSVTNDMLAGSIANAKLANSSITLNGSAVSLGGSASVSNTPAFYVRGLSAQTLSASTNTTLTFDTEVFDTDNAFASNTFTVPSGKAGKYFFSVQAEAVNTQNRFRLFWNKNSIVDTDHFIDMNLSATGDDPNIVMTALLDLSVGDTVEVTGFRADAGDIRRKHFQGYKLIGA